MREEKRRELDEKQQAALLERGGFLDEQRNYMFASEVARRLDITEKTLQTLARSGEFVVARLGPRTIVDVKSLLHYLDRCHFTKRTDTSQEVAVDNKGKIKHNLTYHPQKHTEIPTLRPVDQYAAILHFDVRTFIHHCDNGTFTHYRIGTTYKMSEADWQESLRRASHAEPSVGRPSKVRAAMKKYSRKTPANEKIEILEPEI